MNDTITKTIAAPKPRTRAASAAANPMDREPQTFLSKYNPLVMYERGALAVSTYGIPPYVDSSCRREPDLEHAFPSITTISNGTVFAPKLRVGDVVVFITAKGQYQRLPKEHWRLTAVLKVVERFETHEAAAEWYREKGLPLPGNCMVDGNPPQPLDHTSGVFADEDGKERVAGSTDEWDAGYRRRSLESGVFLVCKPLYVNLRTPQMILEEDLRGIFPNGRMPIARNPSALLRDTVDRLLQACRVKIAPEEIPG